MTSPNSPAAKEVGDLVVFGDLVTAHANAHFHCGEHGDESDDDGYARLSHVADAAGEALIVAHDALLARVSELEAGLKNLLVMLPSADNEGADTDRIPQGFCFVRWADIREARALLEPRPTAQPVVQPAEITAQEVAEIQCGAIGHKFIGGGPDEQPECILCGARP